MTAKTNTHQKLEWNTYGDWTDEILRRVLEGAAQPSNDNDGDTFFDNETLWRELRHRDRNRREAALHVIDACAELAELRAEKYALTYFDARFSILDCGLLDRDLADPETAMSEAAHHVWDAVSALELFRDDTFGSEEHNAWMREMRVEIMKRLHEARRELRKQTADQGSGYV
jgi:hypothetical protein